MSIFIDPPLWLAHGTFFSHLISDTSLKKLHDFAATHEISPRAFDTDHYDGTAPLGRRFRHPGWKGDGGFADAACADKKVNVMDAVMVQRVGQRLGHMRLADQFVKVFRPPFACENLIHGMLF